MRLMQQFHIPRSDLVDAHQHLIDFSQDFEDIYYQRRIDRLHFVRPWIHSMFDKDRDVHYVDKKA
jgi:hypothetical protein